MTNPTHNCYVCGTDFNKEELYKNVKGYTGKCPGCKSEILYEYKGRGMKYIIEQFRRKNGV